MNPSSQKINYEGWSKHIIPQFNSLEKHGDVQRWNWIYLMADDWIFEWKVDEFIRDKQYIEVGILNITTMQRIVDRTFDYNSGSEIVFNDQQLEDIKHVYADSNIKMRINNNLGNHVLKVKSKHMDVNLMFQYNITDNNNMVQLSKLSNEHYQVSVKKFHASVKGTINNITITNQTMAFPIFHIQRAVLPHTIGWYWAVGNGMIKINNKWKKFTINLGYGKEQTDHIVATEDCLFVNRFIIKLAQSWRSSTSKSQYIRWNSQHYLQEGDFKFKFRKLKKEVRNLGYLQFKNKVIRWYGEFEGVFIHKGKQIRFKNIKGISEVYKAEW